MREKKDPIECFSGVVTAEGIDVDAESVGRELIVFPLDLSEPYGVLTRA